MTDTNTEEEFDAVEAIAAALTNISNMVHQMNDIAGWWKDLESGASMKDNQLFIASKLLMIHSEISEATEAHRKGLMDDKLPHRKGLEVELADAMIRIFDLAGALEFDIGWAIVDKLAYNQQRADHKVENRAEAGGKTY
jgi:NTP pyrophosphatase (non-canonical NTP hydrolase)